MLEHFVYAYREEVIRRSRQRLGHRAAPPPTAGELQHGVVMCVDDVIDGLQRSLVMPTSRSELTVAQRRHRLQHEFTALQVVHDYRDVCQAIAEVATEKRVPISAEEFRILRQYVDEAVAAVLAR